MYTIYKLQSTVTDKVYIGCTSHTLWKRYINHRSHFNTGSPSPIYKAIRALGLDIDDFEMIEMSIHENKADALKAEQILIKSLPNAFNYTGNNGVSDKHRKSMSEAQKIATNQPHRKARVSELKKGNTNMLGKTHSDETKKKMSENHWALGTKGVLKANSGSFQKGHAPSETSFKKGNEPWNKGKKGLQKGTCVGRITVNKDGKNKRIIPEDLERYLQQGYVKGGKKLV